MLDDLLPGSMPFNLADNIGSSSTHLGKIYNTHWFDKDNIVHGVRWFLHSKTSSRIVDWEAGYAADNDTTRLLRALKVSGGKQLPTVVVNLVVMGYR